MGFLDKSQDVVDMVLTNTGQKLLAQGKLKFVYWMAFDDEVDYDPYVAASGSMTAMEVTASKLSQIENGLVREAVTGYKETTPLNLDQTNVYRPIFSVPQGQTIIPKIVKIHRTSSLSISVKQQKVVDRYIKKDGQGDTVVESSIDRGFQIQQPTFQTLEYQYTPNSFPSEHPLSGMKVKVFSSGTGGYYEIAPKHDLNDDVAFKSDLKWVPKNG